MIRLRKKYAMRAGLTGALLAAVPLVSVILVLLLFYPNLYDWFYGRTGEKTVQVLALKKDAEAGSVLQEGDMAERETYVSDAPGHILRKEDIMGKRLKVSLSQNTVLTKELVYEGGKIAEDERIHSFDYIQCPDTLKKGDYIDIRISFPNGADFVLLSKKKLESIRMQENAEAGSFTSQVWFQVNEEEILRLSSAVVDQYLTEGTRIYAIRYLLDSQEMAAVNYPVNDVVRQLIERDPNIVGLAQENAGEVFRKLLEEENQQERKEGVQNEKLPLYEENQQKKEEDLQWYDSVSGDEWDQEEADEIAPDYEDMEFYD